MNLPLPDLLVFIGYCLLILSVALFVSRDKKGHTKTTEDYFLAGKSLPWWAIGASLIAANISAEQFIGMSGSGFAVGLAIASYEWMAAITLLIVGKYFLPIFIERKIFTIPGFIEKRYGTELKTILAIFWIALFVFVNLTTVLFLGAKAIDTIIGTGDGSLLTPAVLFLALFAAAYSLWGGLAAVAWTDVLQVALLVTGGLVTVVLALQSLTDGGIFSGMAYLYERVPEKFSMIIQKGEITGPGGYDAWNDLPGIAVLVGGMWVANLYYWGFNQYIIQRTLAAKSLKESQRGIAFAACLKLLIPVIVVVPGIIAFVKNSDASGVVTGAAFLTEDGKVTNDNAFPWLIDNVITITGLKGLVLAALTAAIISSLASILNSIATIFTMDVYKPYFRPGMSESGSIRVGRLSAVAALVTGILLAPQLRNIPQVFQYIQEYTGLVSPGILAVFLAGLFYRKTIGKAAVWGTVLSIPIALYFKIGPEGWVESPLFVTLPFLHQMGLTFLLSLAFIVGLSHLWGKGGYDEKSIPLTAGLFHTDKVFNLVAFSVILVCAFLYAFFW